MVPGATTQDLTWVLVMSARDLSQARGRCIPAPQASV